MASLITVRLNKESCPSWGFRLQGGKDFGTPLVIQKVSGGSPAERAGLIAGDAVIKINNVEVFNLRHKDAQDIVVRSGPSFEMTIQRGGSTWKPLVTPVGQYPNPSPNINKISPVTRTSLAAQQNNERIEAIGTGHNTIAKPYSPQHVNGTLNGGPKLVINQYNSPIRLYSEESIAETLSAQAEVLPTGALGVNFKKNEKNYDAKNSAVYRMLQEAEKDPGCYEPSSVNNESGVDTTPLGVTGLRHVSAPQNKPTPPTPQLPPGQNICAECERLIVGVFVRIKDKNLHVECFKCATCGSSLKNVGYYNINNKLYCDVHAKLAALNNPPAPNLVPVTFDKPPSSFSSVAPPSQTSPRPNYQQNFNTTSSAKPFSSVSAPLSPGSHLYSPVTPATKPARSFLPQAGSVPSRSPTGFTDPKPHDLAWPPEPEEETLPSACPLYFPPPSQFNRTKKESSCYSSTTSLELEAINSMAQFQIPSIMLSSKEASDSSCRKTVSECAETIMETIETQQLVESIMKDRITKEEAKSESSKVETEFKSFKSESDLTTSNGIATTEIELPRQKTVESISSVAKTDSLSTTSLATESTLHQKDQTLSSTAMNPLKDSTHEKAFPKPWESPMLKALKCDVSEPDKKIPTSISKSSKASPGPLASALTTAPGVPFTPQSESVLKPVPLPEETVPYFPPEHPLTKESEESAGKDAGPKKKVFGKAKDPLLKYMEDLPKPQQPMTMLAALTTAPDRSYSPFSQPESIGETSENEDAEKPQKQTYVASTKLVQVQAPKPFEVSKDKKTVVETSRKSEEKSSEDYSSSADTTTKTTKRVEHIQSVPKRVEVAKDIKIPTQFAPLFQGFSCSFQNKTDYSQFQVQIATSPSVTYTEQSCDEEAQEIEDVMVKTETITDETTKRSEEKRVKDYKKVDEMTKIEKLIEKEAAAKSERVQLHKATNIPQYQANLYDGSVVEFSAQKKECARLIDSENVSVAQSTNLHQQEQQKQLNYQQQEQQLARQRQEDLARQQQEQERLARQRQEQLARQRQEQLTLQRQEQLMRQQQEQLERKEQQLHFEHQRQEELKLQHQEQMVRQEQLARQRQEQQVRQQQEQQKIREQQLEVQRQQEQKLYQQQLQKEQQQKFQHQQQQKIIMEQQQQTIRNQQQLHYQQQHQEQQFQHQQLVQQQTGFRAVSEEHHRAVTPTSRSLTPSMINKPAPSLPYYQTNLIAQECVAATSNLYEPTSPAVSRSPSPYPQMQRAVSPFKPPVGTMRAKSPAPGPPPNPLKVTQPSRSSDSRVEEARRNIALHIPQVNVVQTGTEIRSSDLEQREIYQKQTRSKSEVLPSNVKQVQANVSCIKSQMHSKQYSELTEEVKTSQFRYDESQSAKTLAVGQLRGDSNATANLSKENIETRMLNMKQAESQAQISSQASSISAARISSQSALHSNQLAAQEKAIGGAPLKSVASEPPRCPINTKCLSSCAPRVPQDSVKPSVPLPNTGGAGRQSGAIGVAPRRGRGVLNAAQLGGARIPLCGQCHMQIRGPFITALGKIWCPDHFICSTPSCRRPLQDLGFVEEQGQLYCEYCFEQYLAPPCSKCGAKIKEDCLKAIGRNFHPQCFSCAYCGKLFGNGPFFLEDGNPYCENDWNELFTTKCFACGFPVEAGDRWVEALNNNYHSQCFNCTVCKTNLEGQSFFAKGGRPYCRNHAR